MRKLILIFSSLVMLSCISFQSEGVNMNLDQKKLKNEKTRKYEFVRDMYADSYFPKFLVDKVKAILVEFCFEIEKTSPKNNKELYVLSHKATLKINNLQEEFFSNNSELETGARESIGADFEYIAKSYKFDVDVEELIAPREW